MDDSSEESRPERTVTTPTHLRSGVWKYFGFYTVDGKVTDKNTAVCRLCKKQLSYRTTTTNLRAHLLAHHPTEASDAEAPQTSKATPSAQPRLTAYYSAHSTTTGPLPEARKKITDKITRFVCKDMLVGNTFTQMLKTTDYTSAFSLQTLRLIKTPVNTLFYCVVLIKRCIPVGNYVAKLLSSA